MPDSDIPSVVDDNDEDEATMMWNREEFETDGELPSKAEMKAAIHPPPPSEEDGGGELDTGLDEQALFADVLETSEARENASLPVQPLVDEAGVPSIGVGRPAAGGDSEGSDVEAPRVPSLVAPAPRSSSKGVWVLLSVVVLLGAAAAAYLLRDRLGPLGAWLDGLGLRLPF